MRLLFPILLLLTGCVTGKSPEGLSRSSDINLGEEFALALGASTSLTGTPWLLTFERVVEDSRCATGVTCVWEGNARIAVQFMALENWPPDDSNSVSVADQFTAEINTSSRFSTTADHRGLRVELRRLEPSPSADSPTTGYVATMVVWKP